MPDSGLGASCRLPWACKEGESTREKERQRKRKKRSTQGWNLILLTFPEILLILRELSTLHFQKKKRENIGNWKKVRESGPNWPINGRRCVSIMFFTRLEICIFLNQAYSAGKCLSQKSLNIACYIKEVTNQADGERCHRVSILKGRCLSLREPTPSDLTSNNPAHTRSTCTCTQKPEHSYLRGHVHAFMCSYTYVLCVYLLLSRRSYYTHAC